MNKMKVMLFITYITNIVLVAMNVNKTIIKEDVYNHKYSVNNDSVN